MFSAVYLAEIVRGGLQTVPKEQSEAAHTLGLGWWATQCRVVLPQALRAVLPALTNHAIGLLKDSALVTVIGLQFGAVLTGTIITETIFAWPGLGRLLVQAIGFRDYPLVQGCILFIAVTYVAMNVLVDLAYGWLDPRIRLR